MEIRYSITLTFLFLATAWAASDTENRSIKQFPLDERNVYTLKIAKTQATTISFPSKISALEVAGVTADSQTKAPVLLNYREGRYFFSVRALTDDAVASVNVVWNRKTYVLKLKVDEEPFSSVTFFQPAERDAAGSQNAASPTKILSLLDRAKSYPVVKTQYPELVSQVDVAYPNRRMLYKDFTVELAEVYRFDSEDTLIFKVLFFNNSDREIYYKPQSLAIRVGANVYYASVSDASGIMPEGNLDSSTDKIKPSVSVGYFAVTGSPDGGRNNLSVKNKFNVIVTRQGEGSELTPKSKGPTSSNQ